MENIAWWDLDDPDSMVPLIMDSIETKSVLDKFMSWIDWTKANDSKFIVNAIIKLAGEKRWRIEIPRHFWTKRKLI